MYIILIALDECFNLKLYKNCSIWWSDLNLKPTSLSQRLETRYSRQFLSKNSLFSLNGSSVIKHSIKPMINAFMLTLLVRLQVTDYLSDVLLPAPQILPEKLYLLAARCRIAHNVQKCSCQCHSPSVVFALFAVSLFCDVQNPSSLVCTTTTTATTTTF